MSNISRISLLIFFVFTVITSIVVSSNSQHSNLNQNNSVQTPKIAQPNLSINKKAELSPTLETKASSIDATAYKTTPAFEEYKPRYTATTIHPNNYGDRYSIDVYGNSLNNLPIAVLHETTNSVMSAINTFRTPHVNDSDQVSYHTLIALDGTIIS